MDKAVIERLERACIAGMDEEYRDDVLTLLRLARAVANAPRERMWHAGGGTLVAELVLPAVWTELDDETVILLRADAVEPREVGK